MRKRYPHYKPSGVEWLGDVPEHWAMVTLRWVSRRYAGGTPDRANDAYWEDGTIPWIKSGAVNQGLITEPSAFITHEGYSNSSAKWIPKGALVMALAGQGKTKGMVAQVGIDTTCNQSMAAIVPDECVASRFLFWWLSAQYAVIRNLSGGEQRDGLNLDILGALSVPLVPAKEHRAIADFLDHETAKLDTMVAKKRTLIARLKEKRSALISRTVTRGLPPDAARVAGLDPHPKLKPSGIDWLGDVPKHWEIAPMRYLIIGGTRNGMYKPPSDFDDDGIPMVQMSEAFAKPVLDNTAKDRVRVSATELAEWGLLEGDLLFGRRSLVFSGSGKCILVGRLPEPHVFESSLIRVRARRTIADPKYLFHFLGSAYGRAQVLSATKQVTISGVDSQQIKSILVLLPSILEQRAITDFIDRETTKIDRMVAKVETAIERLREYRMALITAAVTGKIDVREALGRREGSVSRASSARMQA